MARESVMMSQQSPVNQTLEDWNRLEQETAAKIILPCNGSLAWALGVVNLYPFDTPEELLAASDKVWLALPEKDWQQAFDSHPRIGEHKAKAATAQSLKWSAGEQSAANPDTATQEALAAANREYEQKFGRIFIVCATGKSAAEMLAILQARLANDPATELKEATEQQRQITQIRLRKWLGIA
ncbi:2-oxo-4-hydroxy-4-carboxy-5-ureidoimidazoline decarboxylase [Granulicella mallensis]|uniref:2-oxo-4-hydroxy-4-carboxy-5-ureidoimidazoline decarboxylase n=1 Tax=Granulicella mallensis TaxID=940614 RepID=A0A7W7ZSD2_9BACT|nr:2-oxo-4-hydroxy-4-carboxy-5-ureidoimidazoline decarboxylase [Granulicella mallensis]MBB5065287.1 2-oxo-4-hydroxy-4-carboxy-5-ureidoimidazoline decarboxylase [Granulicella mallensis]